MILSCPECHARYRLPDDAIPPEGRDVRCAKCSHRWHEPGEVAAPPPTIEAASEEASVAEPVEQSVADSLSEQVVEEVTTYEPAPAPVEPEIPFVQPPVEPPAPVAEPAYDDGPDVFAHEPPFQPKPRRSRWLVVAILVLAVLIGGYAALRLYGPDSIKARLGVAGATPLKLELPRDPERRTLSSGNELFALSGKVVNPSDTSQRVPDIVAELKDASDKPVYRWTITPPKRTIGPKQTLDFDAAEIDVPPGANKLALSFSNRAIG